MDIRCIDYDTCQWKGPMFVPFHVRQRRYPPLHRDGYMPSYCGYCPNYRPDREQPPSIIHTTHIHTHKKEGLAELEQRIKGAEKYISDKLKEIESLQQYKPSSSKY